MQEATKYNQIFISYKRKGGGDFAYMLYDRLTSSGYDVFMDIRSMNKCDFTVEIENNIKHCTDFVIILSPGALDKCNDTNDWLYKELDTALKYRNAGRDINIIGIMRQGFEFPKNLPEKFKFLEKENCVHFHNDYFESALIKLTTKYLDSRPDNDSLLDDSKLEVGVAKNDPALTNEYALKKEIGSYDSVEEPAKALKFYIAAANLGYSAAYYNLGDIFDKCASDTTLASGYGIPITINQSEEDRVNEFYNKAIEYYKAAGDYAPALYRLGVMYEKEHDMDKAFEYYCMAAEQEYPPALNAKAFFYHYGTVESICNIENRKQIAADLYKRASELNLVVAGYNYTVLTEKESPENDIISMYKKAALSDPPIPQAAFALAKYYENKLLDKSMAKHYYQIALENGFWRAENELQRLNQKTIPSR